MSGKADPRVPVSCTELVNYAKLFPVSDVNLLARFMRKIDDAVFQYYKKIQDENTANS